MWGMFLLLALLSAMALLLWRRRRQPRGRDRRHRASACLGGEESYPGD